MQLTIQEIKALQALKDLKGKPLTFMTLLKKNRFKCVLFSLFFLYFCIIFVIHNYILALISSALLGALAREVGQGFLMIKTWPLSQQITDWNKVDELLAENKSQR